MAIAVEMTFTGPGATLANYLEAIKEMGATPEGPHPDSGCMFHWVNAVPGGFHVIDVWNAQDEFDRFAKEKIGPVSAALGIPAPPAPKITQIDNYLTAG